MKKLLIVAVFMLGMMGYTIAQANSCQRNCYNSIGGRYCETQCF